VLVIKELRVLIERGAKNAGGFPVFNNSDSVSVNSYMAGIYAHRADLSIAQMKTRKSVSKRNAKMVTLCQLRYLWRRIKTATGGRFDLQVNKGVNLNFSPARTGNFSLRAGVCKNAFANTVFCGTYRGDSSLK
jgi:hypothetical protein